MSKRRISMSWETVSFILTILFVISIITACCFYSSYRDASSKLEYYQRLNNSRSKLSPSSSLNSAIRHSGLKVKPVAKPKANAKKAPTATQVSLNGHQEMNIPVLPAIPDFKTTQRLDTDEKTTFWVRTARKALHSCHLGKITPHASYLKLALAHISPEMIARGCSKQEINKYLAKEALFECRSGNYGEFAAKLESFLKSGIPTDKIEKSLTIEEVDRFVKLAKSREETPPQANSSGNQQLADTTVASSQDNPTGTKQTPTVTMSEDGPVSTKPSMVEEKSGRDLDILKLSTDPKAEISEQQSAAAIATEPPSDLTLERETDTGEPIAQTPQKNIQVLETLPWFLTDVSLWPTILTEPNWSKDLLVTIGI